MAHTARAAKEKAAAEMSVGKRDREVKRARSSFWDPQSWRA
jgi:hypothetical protein